MYDCYEVLESVAWIWRVLGMFPFTIKYSMGVKKYRISKFYAIYDFVVCISCTIHFVYLTYLYMTHVKINVVVITITIRITASILNMTVFSIWRIYRYKEFEECIQIMATLETFLEKFNCPVNYGSNAKLVGAYVWTSLTTVLLLMVYDLFASGRFFGKLHWLLYIVPLLAQVINLTIFVSLIGLLGLKFRALNIKMKTVVARANASSPKTIVTSDVCAENLMAIAKIHYKIVAVGKRINSFFNLDVIINVITAFIILSTTLYYIFVEVQKDGPTNYIRIGTFVHWEFIHSVPIIVIVAICNWTSNQSIHTGKLIHEIRIEKIDSRLYEAVKSFSLQLHHQKLEFNAAGFFPLNSTLIQTIVGNITTYLVILIQFQPSLD